MPIIVQKDDLTKIKCDAIVNPANSYGFMGGGVAGAIKKVGGQSIEEEAISQAPIDVGKAIITKGGNLCCKYVIHAPTMEEPAMRIGVENVKLATRAALEIGIKNKIKTIAIPGMGTGVGQVPIKDAAKAIVEISKEYEKSYKKIILLDRNEEIINIFQNEINKI